MAFKYLREDQNYLSITSGDVKSALGFLPVVKPSVVTGAAVNLGGVNYSFTPSSPNQYHVIAWSTIKFNQSGFWATVAGGVGLSAGFVPPSGTNLIMLDCQIFASGGVSNTPGNWVVKWIKNPQVDGNGFQIVATGTDVLAGIGSISDAGANTAIIRASGYDVPSPGDFYIPLVFIDSTNLGVTAITIDGNAAHTYAMAACLP